MVVSFDSFTTAIGAYIESEIVQKAPSNRRLLLGAVAMVAPAIVARKANDYSQYVKAIGMIDEEGNIEIDALEDMGTKLIEKYGQYQFKLLDVSVNITKEDVISFCQMLRNM